MHRGTYAVQDQVFIASTVKLRNSGTIQKDLLANSIVFKNHSVVSGAGRGSKHATNQSALALLQGMLLNKDSDFVYDAAHPVNASAGGLRLPQSNKLFPCVNSSAVPVAPVYGNSVAANRFNSLRMNIVRDRGLL